MAQSNFDPNMREDPQTMSLYFKYIDDIKELAKYDSLNERMAKWKEICDKFEDLCITSEQRKKFLTISELVLKSKFSGMSLQLFDGVSSEIKNKVKSFSLTKFSEKLKIRCKDENGVVDLSFLAAIALSAFRPAPHILYLRGTDFFVDIQAPAKKPRTKYAKDPVEEKTKPAAIVTKKSDVPENEIAVVFNALQSAYKRMEKRPVIYWKLVIDPLSFSRTVENIFYVSFLIRENLAKIFLRDDETLMIEPTNVNGKTKDKNHKLDQNHTIISVGHNEWKNLITHFNIAKAMIRWKS